MLIHSHRQNITISFVLAAVMGATIPPAFAKNTIWQAPKGYWFDSANWDNGSPNSSDNAIIDNKGTATIDRPGQKADGIYLGRSKTGTLNIKAGGTLDSTFGVLGQNPDGEGHVTVTGQGSTWTNSGNLTVGRAGTGTLTVENGGVVSNQQGKIGALDGATGDVTVTGQGSTWSNASLFVGAQGTGTLTVANGGTVNSNKQGLIGRGKDGTGHVTVSGQGSTWDISEQLFVGGQGKGTLVIKDGGQVTNAKRGFIGNNGTGEVTVTGPGSSWNNGTDLVIGNQGTGTLTIKNNGIVAVPGLTALGNQSGSNGTLNIGDGGAAGLLKTETIVGYAGTATLNFNHNESDYVFSNDGTAAGTPVNITGSVTVKQTGPGTTILTGNNTYTGGTIISDGTLQIGAGSTTGSISGPITDNSALVFNRSNGVTYDGQLSGTGTLTQAGGGTLTLTGDSSAFVGTTTIKNGTLIVGPTASDNAWLGGHVIVNPGTTLAGHGTVGSIISAGTVSPGHSIGTLTVNGDYVAQKGSTLAAQINADGGHDLLHVTGQATLNGGTVNVDAAKGYYTTAMKYTLVQADGGRTGQYDTLSTNLAFLDPFLKYTTDKVILRFKRNGSDFTDVANTSNERATAGAVEALGSGSALYAAVTGLSAADARQAFNDLSGEYYASAMTGMLADSGFVRTAVSDRLDQVCNGDNPNANTGEREQACGGHVWMQAYGNWSRFDSDGNAAELDHDISGLFIGADQEVLPGIRLGFVAGYGHASNHVDARQSSGSDDTYRLGAYGAFHKGNFAFKLGAVHAWHNLDSRRYVQFHGVNQSLDGDYHAHASQVFAEAGYTFSSGPSSIEPFIRGAYVHLHSDSFDEQGGSAALHVDSATHEITTTLTGVRLDHLLNPGAHTVIHLRGLIGWRHNYSDTTPETQMAFLGYDTPFTVQGVPLAKDAIAAQAGLGAHIGHNLTVGASFVGQFGDGTESKGIKADATWRF